MVFVVNVVFLVISVARPAKVKVFARAALETLAYNRSLPAPVAHHPVVDPLVKVWARRLVAALLTVFVVATVYPTAMRRVPSNKIHMSPYPIIVLVRKQR